MAMDCKLTEALPVGALRRTTMLTFLVLPIFSFRPSARMMEIFGSTDSTTPSPTSVSAYPSISLV